MYQLKLRVVTELTGARSWIMDIQHKKVQSYVLDMNVFWDDLVENERFPELLDLEYVSARDDGCH